MGDNSVRVLLDAGPAPEPVRVLLDAGPAPGPVRALLDAGPAARPTEAYLGLRVGQRTLHGWGLKLLSSAALTPSPAGTGRKSLRRLRDQLSMPPSPEWWW